MITITVITISGFHCISDRRTERQKERETERQRSRQRDRKTERQKDRKTERQKDRKTKRQLCSYCYHLLFVIVITSVLPKVITLSGGYCN